MTHEFKDILEAYIVAQKLNQKMVLATVVAVDGSSYRGAGVRMLVLENDNSIGAISGGCVEKEVVRQSKSVFDTGTSKLMTYDGRFRLGCEGTLFVLLELFSPELNDVAKIKKTIEERKTFVINSHFDFDEKKAQNGSVLQLSNSEIIPLGNFQSAKESECERFSETLQPCFRLVIVGTEHDSASLCLQASNLNWEVLVVAAPNSKKEIQDFPGATNLIKMTSEEFVISNIDQQTAFVLMNHNYAKDLLYLKALKNTAPCYIGLLGPSKRKEQMLSAFIEYHFEVEDTFLDCIYGPAGLDIGSETPAEIANSIISEIIAVTRNKKVNHLQDKKGAIHDRKYRKTINAK